MWRFVEKLSQDLLLFFFFSCFYSRRLSETFFSGFSAGNDYVLHEIGKIMQVFWDKSVLPNEAGRANRAATWICESGSQSQSRQIEIDTFSLRRAHVHCH